MIVVAKPFRVGDVVCLDGGPFLHVVDVGILTSVFTRADGIVVQIRNAQLYQSQLGSFSNSARLVHSVTFLVDPWTTMSKVQSLASMVNAFAQKEMPYLHCPCSVDVSDFNPVNAVGYIETRVQVRYRKAQPPADYPTWKKQRTLLLIHLQQVLRDLNIQIKAPGGWLDTHFDSNAMIMPKE